MKLYFTRGACSFAPHIVLRELGADFELASVNLQEKTLADGSDFRSVNPKGYVPFLQTEDVGGLSHSCNLYRSGVPAGGARPLSG